MASLHKKSWRWTRRRSGINMYTTFFMCVLYLNSMLVCTRILCDSKWSQKNEPYTNSNSLFLFCGDVIFDWGMLTSIHWHGILQAILPNNNIATKKRWNNQPKNAIRYHKTYVNDSRLSSSSSPLKLLPFRKLLFFCVWWHRHHYWKSLAVFFLVPDSSS